MAPPQLSVETCDWVRGLPAVYSLREYALAGGLMSYGATIGWANHNAGLRRPHSQGGQARRFAGRRSSSQKSRRCCSPAPKRWSSSRATAHIVLLRSMSPEWALLRHRESGDRRPLSGKPDIRRHRRM